MKFNTPLAIALLLSVSCIGQSINTPKIIDQLSTLRHLLVKDSTELIKLQETTSKWGKAQFQSDEFYGAVKTVGELKSQFNFEDEYILKKVYKRFESIGIEKYIMASDIQVISNSIELLHLVFEGIFHSNHPYTLNLEPKILKELDFYDIKPKDRLLYIEGGNGMVPLLICMINEGVNLTLSIPNGKLLFEMSEQLRMVESNINIENVKTGNWEMEEEIYDRIIVRNVFHHLKNKKSKLNTLHSALSQNGELIILEPDASSNKANTICPKSMELTKVISTIENVNFQLHDQLKQSEHYQLLKFQKI